MSGAETDSTLEFDGQLISAVVCLTGINGVARARMNPSSPVTMAMSFARLTVCDGTSSDPNRSPGVRDQRHRARACGIVSARERWARCVT